MTHEETAKRRAWAAIHFGNKNLAEADLDNVTYSPSENFSDGWDKGAEYALLHQWVDPKDRKPDVCTFVLVQPLDRRGCRTAPVVAMWDGVVWTTPSGRPLRPYAWMPIPLPVLTPQK